jgi:branched-chain amino acid transport system permease protein
LPRRNAPAGAFPQKVARQETPVLTILFDGIAYGMLLFILACGLAVTLGLMNFVNLAHGAFAMAGGYVTALLMNRAGVPFLATLPLAFLVPAALGLVLERTLYSRLYGKSHLDQVLFSIGLVFMAVAAVDYTITPHRFTPGWELVLSKRGMALAYAAMALGFVATPG